MVSSPWPTIPTCYIIQKHCRPDRDDRDDVRDDVCDDDPDDDKCGLDDDEKLKRLLLRHLKIVTMN